MQQQIASIVSELESARTRLHRLADNLPDARWKSRPAAGRWSAAECVEHLNLTSRAYLPLLRRALESATKSSAPPTRHQRDFLGWLFSNMVGPVWTLGKRKVGRVKTTGEFAPTITPERMESIADFDRLQDELLSIAREAENYPISDLKIVSPFGGRIRYNVYSALRILPRHQERHLEQAEEAATARS